MQEKVSGCSHFVQYRSPHWSLPRSSARMMMSTKRLSEWNVKQRRDGKGDRFPGWDVFLEGKSKHTFGFFFQYTFIFVNICWFCWSSNKFSGKRSKNLSPWVTRVTFFALSCHHLLRSPLLGEYRSISCLGSGPGVCRLLMSFGPLVLWSSWWSSGLWWSWWSWWWPAWRAAEPHPTQQYEQINPHKKCKPNKPPTIPHPVLIGLKDLWWIPKQVQSLLLCLLCRQGEWLTIWGRSPSKTTAFSKDVATILN